MTALFAWQNYTKSATTPAGSAAPNMPASSLANDSGSSATAWQTAAGVTTSAGGAWVQIRPTTTGQTWRTFGIFRSNLTAAATVQFVLYIGTSTVVASVTASPAAGYKQVVAVLPSDTVADWLQININDSANPDTFINVPLAFCGPAWLPIGGVSFASTVGRDDSTAEVVTRGGQEYPTLYFQRRRWNVALESLRSSETWAKADALNLWAKAGSNALFIPNTTSTDIQSESIFGRLKSTADISYPYGAADRRRWQLQVTERL